MIKLIKYHGICKQFMPNFKYTSNCTRMDELFKILHKCDGSGNARVGQLQIAVNGGDINNYGISAGDDSEQGVYTAQTPMYFIHTVAGSIPHITAEVLDIVFKSKIIPPIQLSIDSIYTLIDCVGPSKLSLSKFVGLPMCPSFLTVNNPLTDLPTDFNNKLGVAVWSRLGRRTLSASKFSDIISEFKPSLYQVLSDYDISRQSSKKRLKRSIDRNLDYITKTLETMKSEQSCLAYVTLEITWFLVDETQSYKALATILEHINRIAGFLINGVSELINAGSMKEGVGLEDKAEIFNALSKVFSKLPDDKPKFVVGVFLPSQLIELVRLGVDQFDSSIVTQLSNKGQAFGFSLDEFVGEENAANETLVYHKNSADENNHDGTAENLTKVWEDESIILNLANKIYFDDFRPLLDECSCYTCRKYTRSYVHHLLVTEELLGKVLLMSHNLFHFDRFFRSMRCCLTDSTNLRKLQVSATIQDTQHKNSLKNHCVAEKS